MITHRAQSFFFVLDLEAVKQKKAWAYEFGSFISLDKFLDRNLRMTNIFRSSCQSVFIANLNATSYGQTPLNRTANLFCKFASNRKRSICTSAIGWTVLELYRPASQKLKSFFQKLDEARTSVRMFEIDTSRAAELAYKKSESQRDSPTLHSLKELSSSYIAMSGDSSKTESIEFSNGEASFTSDSFLYEPCSFVSSKNAQNTIVERL